MDYRILKNEKCSSCSGKISYFPEKDEFKCISCGKPYDTSEDKAKEARRKFWASPRGRQVQKNYFQTEKGKEAHQIRYPKSVKGKLNLRRYYYSDKGQEAHKRHQDKVKSYKKIDAWLKENPGKTVQDALLAFQPNTSREPGKENNAS